MKEEIAEIRRWLQLTLTDCVLEEKARTRLRFLIDELLKLEDT